MQDYRKHLAFRKFILALETEGVFDYFEIRKHCRQGFAFGVVRNLNHFLRLFF